VPIEAGATLASAIRIGHPVSLPKAVEALLATRGVVEQASEQELADAVARADRTGMFNCPHTGVALAALIKLIRAGKVDKTEHVVVISTAHGLKFADFKVDYHEGKLDFPSRYSNKPIEVRASVDAVKDALRSALKTRRVPNA